MDDKTNDTTQPAPAAQDDAKTADQPAPEAIPAPAKEPENPAAQEPAANDLAGGGAEKNAASDKTPDGGQQPGDGQTEQQDPDDGNTPKADPYGEFTLPEGVVLAAEPMKEFKTLAQELGLPKDSAQKLLDLQGKVELARAAEQQKTMKTLQQQWRAAAEAEYGARMPEVLSAAAKAMDTYGGAELRDALEEMGIGNHPVLIRAFAKIGQTIGEDKLVSSKTQSGGDKTFTEALYGHKNK